jgi:ABC-type uncharacterized transport system substrate-binding protein
MTRLSFALVTLLAASAPLAAAAQTAGRSYRVAILAKELADSRADVIVTLGYPAARAAKDAAGPVPIVVTNAGDPFPLRDQQQNRRCVEPDLPQGLFERADEVIE